MASVVLFVVFVWRDINKLRERCEKMIVREKNSVSQREGASEEHPTAEK